jgi:pimeloyl-ACP methyl ester carboxylesterase
LAPQRLARRWYSPARSEPPFGPGVLIHGRLDLGGPPITPWRLVQHWPGSELVIVGGAGHDARDPGMCEAVVAATNRLNLMQRLSK